MEPYISTQFFAIWGAITGSIGTIAGVVNLVLRIKQHNNDKPKLICTSNFLFTCTFGDNVPEHNITVRSVGKRPVTIDYIRYCIEPNTFWGRLFKKRLWKKHRHKHDCYPGIRFGNVDAPIAEGQKIDFQIKLPDGLEENKVLKVEIHDQTGNIWPVKWPRKSKLATLVHHEKLHESVKSNDIWICEFHGYTAGGKFLIRANWNTIPNNKDHLKGIIFRQTSEREYKAKLKELLEIQQEKFLAGKINSFN